jgi:hypothetical protein
MNERVSAPVSILLQLKTTSASRELFAERSRDPLALTFSDTSFGQQHHRKRLRAPANSGRLALSPARLVPQLLVCESTGVSLRRISASRILTALSALFLLMDGGMKLFKPPFVIESTARLGYPESTIVGIGVTLLVCTVLYLIPRTAVLGAILLAAYLGRAVASNVRAGTPVFNMLFPMLFGVMVWASLVLRDKRLESHSLEGRIN